MDSDGDNARSHTMRAFNTLKTDILSGALKPGDKLRLEEIRSRYGFGLTPLREALTRLAAHHLVVIDDQRGFRVADATVDDMRDVNKARQTLEVFLLGEAIDNGDDAWILGIRRSFALLSDVCRALPDPYGEEWESAHRDFHFSLISASRSPLLSSFHKITWDKASRYRLLGHAREDANLLMSEHEQLMQAATAREKTLACAILERHIRIWSERSLDAPPFETLLSD